MALYHIQAAVISKGQEAKGFAVYLLRLDQDNARQHRQYLEREGHSREDLVASGSMRLPAWARDAEHFWQMADRHERQKGVVARTYQFTLPRELSTQGRLDLADDIRQTFFARYPHTWAVHCPGNNPYLHVMFSPRREDTPSDRTPAQWFRQAARPGDDPQHGGVRKDGRWDQKRTLQGVRYEYAVLCNAALEREGHHVAVNHQRLSVRGHRRDAERSLPRAQIVLLKKYAGQDLDQIANTKDRAQVAQAREAMAELDVNRVLLHKHFHVRENAKNLEAWTAQKQREGIRDLSRDAIVDLVRDRFWAHDKSPGREQERLASLERTINREYGRTGRVRSAVQEREQAPRQERSRTRTRELGWIRGGLEDMPHGGVKLTLEEARGLHRG